MRFPRCIEAIGCAVAFFLFFFVGVQADLCALGRQEIDGNWFCQPVKAIQYSNVGRPGTYQQVIGMAADGTCTRKPKAFSGPIAPLDGEISLHFRGPIEIKQFAAYTPHIIKAASKRGQVKVARRKPHQRMHARNKPKVESVAGAEHEKRQMITATINGQAVSWMNNWFGPSSTSAILANPDKDQWVTATIDGQAVSWINNWQGPPSQTSAPVQTLPPVAALYSEALSGQPPKTAEGPTATHAAALAAGQNAATNQDVPVGPKFHEEGTFERIAYYHAESQIADNIAFLGNFGGQGSGVFDLHFGASISYVNCNGTGGSASPQVLANIVIPSDSEVIMMLGQKCANDDCGYVRPGSVAHHGFGGSDKVFLIEFRMPKDGKTGFNGNMPAIWALNAEIARTVQYGPPDCSCWDTGCGEFDIVEALFDGSDFLKSTLHTNTPGGDSDYIIRPTSKTMKLAVVFSSATSTIHIQVLDDGMAFEENVSAKDMNEICSAHAENLISHFAIAG